MSRIIAATATYVGDTLNNDILRNLLAGKRWISEPEANGRQESNPVQVVPQPFLRPPVPSLAISLQVDTGTTAVH